MFQIKEEEKTLEHERMEEVNKIKLELQNNGWRADSVCGDIPFQFYLQTQSESDELYLQFLKDLEASENTHDYLFFLFDILCSNTSNIINDTYDDSNHVIPNDILNETM